MSPRFKIRNMSDEEPPIVVDPTAVVMCYVALDFSLHERINKSLMDQVQRLFQPLFWQAVLNTGNKLDNRLIGVAGGEIESNDVLAGLEKIVALDTHSTTLSPGKLSFDGGKSMTKIFAGFSFRDLDPRVTLPRDNGIVPLTAGAAKTTASPKEKRKWWQFSK